MLVSAARFAAWTLALALLLAGCATPERQPPADPQAQVWTGRLALTVEGNQSQSFSAGFELQGRPETGQLTLFNPLGGTLAVLAWSPGAATLRSGDKVQQFESVEALAVQATGAPLPITALFDWLRGVETPVAGWQADVSQVAQGRLRAQRNAPPPVAELRVAFER
jgi:outer membrane lipoprotein LolB